MAGGIRKVKRYADSFAVLIADVLNADVMMIDKDMNVVGSALRHFPLQENLGSVSLLAQVLTNNRNICLQDKADSEICRMCGQYKNCRIKGFIGIPVHYRNEVAGVLALLLSKSRAKKLFAELPYTLQFLESMANLVGFRMNEHAEKNHLKKQAEKAQAILNIMPDAMVHTDKYGNVIYANQAFGKLFAEQGEINNLKEIYADVLHWYRKKKRVENVRLSLEYKEQVFYGTFSCEPLKAGGAEEGFISYFKPYQNIHENTAPFLQGTLVTFSWLSKYVKKSVIEEAKLLADKDENILIHSDDNAINELLAKAIFNYSQRKLREIKVIYMQNVYRDLLDNFLMGEYGVIRNMDRGTLIIVQPEKMTLYVQDKLADYMVSERLRCDSKKAIAVDVRFIFCTTEDLYELVQRRMFSEKLYQQMSRNAMQSIDTIHSDYALFEKFVRSGIKYYQSVYKQEAQSLDREMLDNLWACAADYDLGNLELLLESIVRNGMQEYSGTRMVKEGGGCAGKSMAELEKEYLKRLLDSQKSKQEICRILGISRSTLYRRIKEYQF